MEAGRSSVRRGRSSSPSEARIPSGSRAGPSGAELREPGGLTAAAAPEGSSHGRACPGETSGDPGARDRGAASSASRCRRSSANAMAKTTRKTSSTLAEPAASPIPIPAPSTPHVASGRNQTSESRDGRWPAARGRPRSSRATRWRQDERGREGEGEAPVAPVPARSAAPTAKVAIRPAVSGPPDWTTRPKIVYASWSKPRRAGGGRGRSRPAG